ncbi:MAG: exopolysaccharide biosynthesis protein [Thermobacillus sp. ZCTH02-B1]|uniref:phosphodiester glycosidase family protein n=1 Tax=Thermobacillus sp. ZCTH02-B1 TaxID=1858795 RepID=UPI000B574872|nr:phosphodiester glycosidase family protein [Thermobacillus sp. ZCTH02-B1]OUM94852.1 MAG: exopolysaccharide biosynthesis protein [Thermobacillus sp. ZCTH02-B1]
MNRILTPRAINRLFLLAAAPFLGLGIWLAAAGSDLTLTLSDRAYPAFRLPAVPEAGTRIAEVSAGLDEAIGLARETRESLRRSAELYALAAAEAERIAKLAAAQVGRPYAIYDRRITARLGKPVEEVRSGRITAQLFHIKAQHFNGYALKVKLKSDKAMTMVLGQDKLGGAETTLSAVKRYGAVAGVNAGGFWDSGGKRYPLGTTIVDGQYVDGFVPTYKDLFFVGMNDKMQLIGGKFEKQEELDRLKPRFGASFVPILMKNGRAQPIPEKWKTNPRRAPRTVIANYKDDQLLILVVDGYDEKGSSGATLEELQILLKRYGVKDAYNLDGGGSSSLVFNGRVVNKPSDGELRKLPTHFLFFK